MALALASFSKGGGSQKRKSGVLKESSEDNSSIGNLLFLASTTASSTNVNQPIKKSKIKVVSKVVSTPGTAATTTTTTPLISSCSSASCEESCSSNYSEQAFSEIQVVHEPHTTSTSTSVATHRHNRNTRRKEDNEETKQKRYLSSHQSRNNCNDLDADSSSSSYNSYRRSNEVKGQMTAALKPLHSNLWDESTLDLSTSASTSTTFSSFDDKKKGNDSVVTSSSSSTTTTTIHVRCTPTARTCRPRDSKVEGLMFDRTHNSLHSERTITWEDTHWYLRPLSSSARKKRKTIRTMTITTEDDTRNDDDNDDNEKEMNENENENDTMSNEWLNNRRRWKRRSRQNIIKECNMPRNNNDSVQWKLWKRLNEPDDTQEQQQNCLPQVPIITHHDTRRMQLTTNHALGDQHQSSSIDSPYILYRWLRVRLAAGFVRSSFDFLHRLLKKYYDEAKEVLKKLNDDARQKHELALLMNLRDRLAGIWCVYAHFTLEVGCLALAEERANTSSSHKKNNTTCYISASSKITAENNRHDCTNADLNFVDMATGGIDLNASSKNTISTRNFEDDQDFSTIPSDRSHLPATPKIQPIRNFNDAVEDDSQRFSNSSKNAENTPTASFAVMMATSTYNGGKDFPGFMDYMKIRTPEEFEAAPAKKLSEEYFEYRKRPGMNEFKNVRSAKSAIYILKKVVKKIYNTQFEKRQSPKQKKARKVSLENTCNEEREKNIPSEQKDFTFEGISNHAISILLAARDCPLVGNHTAIAVSLGRIIVSSSVMEQSKAGCIRSELSREILSAKIRSAIDVCWDNIDTCRSKLHQNRRFTTKPVSKATTIRSISNFELKNQKLQTENRIRKHVVQEGIESTLLLPMTLRSSLSSTSLSSEGVVIGDRNTIRSLCGELNRWSRLGEELEINPHRTIRLAPSHDSKLSFAAEELPLFAPLESLSDPLNHYEDAVGAGKGIIWQW